MLHIQKKLVCISNVCVCNKDVVSGSLFEAFDALTPSADEGALEPELRVSVLQRRAEMTW